jgi:hypothetical protein
MRRAAEHRGAHPGDATHSLLGWALTARTASEGESLWSLRTHKAAGKLEPMKHGGEPARGAARPNTVQRLAPARKGNPKTMRPILRRVSLASQSPSSTRRGTKLCARMTA